MLNGMLVVTRFVRDDAENDGFVQQAHTALAALAACPGYLRGRLARALDEPTHWTIVTEWQSVGAYRRALSSFDVKVHATPLLATALDVPGGFEALVDVAPDGSASTRPSDRTDRA